MDLTKEATEILEEGDRNQALGIVSRLIRQEKDLKIRLLEIQADIELTREMTITDIIRKYAGEGDCNYGGSSLHNVMPDKWEK